jgi:acetyl esterase/lipase
MWMAKKLMSQFPHPILVFFFNSMLKYITDNLVGRKPVQVRLISYEVHEGMIGEATNRYKSKPPARGLLIHCHGGGFVAQSSLSHECYLREWAKQIKVPILSIDYSLAPEAPFPRALEEVTYAYCWALKNCQLLGSTGKILSFKFFILLLKQFLQLFCYSTEITSA